MGRPKGSKNKPKTTANTRARSSSKAQEYDAPLMGDEAAIIITFAVSLFLFLLTKRTMFAIMIKNTGKPAERQGRKAIVSK